jgi:hypothetical protein
MQRKPILPLGAKAPWVLAGLAIALAAWGVWTGNDQMILAGVLTAIIGLVVFPLADWLLAKGEQDDY